MRPVTPIQVAEIPLVEANYLRATVQQIWEDMAILLGGSVLIGLCALPVILLVWWMRSSLFWAVADFTVVPAWVACCYLAGRTPVNRKPYLADFFAALVRYYWQSCLLGLPTAILLVMVLVSFPLLAGATSLLLAVGVGFQIIGLFIVLAVFIFAVPILGNFQVKVQQAWLYGLALLLRNPMVALWTFGDGVSAGNRRQCAGVGGVVDHPPDFYPI